MVSKVHHLEGINNRTELKEPITVIAKSKEEAILKACTTAKEVRYIREELTEIDLGWMNVSGSMT